METQAKVQLQVKMRLAKYDGDRKPEDEPVEVRETLVTMTQEELAAWIKGAYGNE